MIAARTPTIAERWKYWGAGFAVEPCNEPAYLELLLIDTAIQLRREPRLLPMAVTWLTEHFDIVDLAELTSRAQELRGRDSAALGLLLETAQQFIGDPVLENVLSACHPWEAHGPLYDFIASRPALRRIARENASPVSRKWGLWVQPLQSLKRDAMRPESWIARHNPSFVLRTLLKGDVRSKVMAALGEDGLRDATETDLTRRAGCTRRAMHLALANLESAGLITQERRGRCYAINACDVRLLR